VAGLIVGEVLMAMSAFAQLTYVPEFESSPSTSQTAEWLFIIGVVLSVAGLVALVIGLVNMAGNVDLVAWRAHEEMRRAGQGINP